MLKTAHMTTHRFKSVSFDVKKCQQEKVVIKQKGHFCVLTFLFPTLFLFFFFNQPMISQCFLFFLLPLPEFVQLPGNPGSHLGSKSSTFSSQLSERWAVIYQFDKKEKGIIQHRQSPQSLFGIHALSHFRCIPCGISEPFIFKLTT